MLLKIFVNIIFFIFTLFIYVKGEKPKIVGYDKYNHEIIIEDPIEIRNNNIESIKYFIVGDREKYPDNPLIFNSPQDGSIIVSVMLQSMQNFIENKYPNIYGKLEIITWDNTDLCDDTNGSENCPSLVLQGTTSFPYHYHNDHVISLNDYFEEYMNNNKNIFSTKFIKQVEYEYSIDGYYVAVPLITDIRIMYFNILTYKNAGLDFPPPLGNRKSWTWKDLVDDVRKLDKYFEENNIQSNPFDFYGLYDEEMKFLSIILRNYGVPTISSENRCGYCSSEINRNNTIKAIDEVVRPLFEIINKRRKKHEWCTFKETNPIIEKWLKTKDDNQNVKNEYRDLKNTSIECVMNVRNNSTDGIIFSSPPSMAGNNIVTTKAELSSNKGLGVAYVPGNFSFLGGSGLMITKKVSKERQKIAWEYILHLTEGKYLNDIGKGSLMLPPYDTILNDPEWNNSNWDIYIQQLRDSFPIQYPRRTFPEFSQLEVKHPLRYMFFDLFERGTKTAIAVKRVCNDIDYNLEGKCTMNDYAFNKDKCKKGKLIFAVKKNENFSCHGGVEIDTDNDEIYTDCPYEDYDSTYGLIILVLIIGGITLSVIYISLFTAYRKADPIRRASYWFSVIIVFGSILMYISVLLDLGVSNSNFCYIKMWLLVLGFGCSLGGLVVKAFRIYSIFNNRDLKPLVITDRQLFKYFGIIMGIEIFFLILWSYFYTNSNKDSKLSLSGSVMLQYTETNKRLLSTNSVTNSTLSYTPYQYEYCKPYSSFPTLLLIYSINCILILTGCFYSIKTWSIPQMYSETKFVASTIFMIGFIVLVCVPTVSSFEDYDIKNRFVLSSLAICFTCILATSVFCIPKIYNSYLYFKQDYLKRVEDQNSNSLEYSTNNIQIKFINNNTNSLGYSKSQNKGKFGNNRNSNGILLSNDALHRAAVMGNTLIDGNMLGINSSKYNQGLSMLNSSEINSSSIYHKRVSRCQIINNELQCPDCGCVFEIAE
ncbi:hypothetical protein H8356DRAFT_1052196 [Neocallimastix lanati (nom. inval.)]|nr:hypothetical protein H8356DRAFT_1052196 [Neocallimastix sp. JGI-2020a]